jgi:hypothetical protein
VSMAAAFEDIFRVDGKKRYINQFYIREILEFLQRGHSLLEPGCRCVHDIGSERAAELVGGGTCDSQWAGSLLK